MFGVTDTSGIEYGGGDGCPESEPGVSRDENCEPPPFDSIALYSGHARNVCLAEALPLLSDSERASSMIDGSRGACETEEALF